MHLIDRCFGVLQVKSPPCGMHLIDRCFGVLQVKSPKAFNQRIYSLIKDAMDIKGDLTVAPIDEAAQVCPAHNH